MYTILTRHPTHPAGKWHHDGAVYETREQAVDAAHEQWDGTGVTWRLMTIPMEDPDYEKVAWGSWRPLPLADTKEG